MPRRPVTCCVCQAKLPQESQLIRCAQCGAAVCGGPESPTCAKACFRCRKSLCCFCVQSHANHAIGCYEVNPQ